MVVVSSTFSVPVEGVILETPSTKLFMNDQELGTATLYITEHNVVWGGGVSATGGPSPTISLLYPNISLHAVQRDPVRALYMVLNYELRLAMDLPSGDAPASHEDDEFDANDEPITQLRFIPPNDNDLQLMYSAMSQGQALHPDPHDIEDEDPYVDGEDLEDDEEFEDAEESEDAASRLQHIRLDNGNGQYEDCEDPSNEQN
ncbi:methylosome subunit pICln [Leptidea sinapis]|uniref:Methylosome subunit pICln n=1 Tax=Leptidea sinapis TaxID=189913 RepID=A0A5E4Q9V4_9NEOP|nr:methylosome subunit pICln [Leptidea sinapis]VVC94527.1 unnamed protein product [Leptidea sinapis]